MRKIIVITVIVLGLVSMSCRDDQKEAEATKAVVEKIETIESETEQVVKGIEESAEDLNKDLEAIEKELNNL